MNKQQIKQQTLNFFQTEQHPHVFSEDVRKDQLLKNIAIPLNLEESLKILDGVINAIIHLITYSLNPSQIHIQHIVKHNDQWGLQYAICYRCSEQQRQDYDDYDSSQYHQHYDSQQQLIWCLGKLWYWLLTGITIGKVIETDSDLLLFELNQKNISQKGIKLLLNMLNTQPLQRITFRSLISSQLFESESQYQKQSLVYYMSNSIKYISKSNNSQHNPYQQYLFYRQFQQQLDIDNFLESIRKFIKDNFINQNQNYQVDYACQIINAQRYLNFKEIEKIRQQKGFNLILNQNKKLYSQFIRRMIQLQCSLKRISKLKKYQYFRDKYKTHFDTPSKINQEIIYQRFVYYLISYFKKLRDRLIGNKKIDLPIIRNTVKLLIGRTSCYLFKSPRQYLFRKLCQNQILTVKEIINNINTTQDYQKLEKLQIQILELYLKKKQQDHQ